MEFPHYIQSAVAPHQADFYLRQSFPFYQDLNAANQQVFLARLCDFLESKKFVPRKNLVITDEMRVLISACAVQLTMGLENYHIDYFENVLVYPDIYQSAHSDHTHHGEVNLAGFICFSWASLEKGIGRNDNFNVGLHEWAHALRFNGFRGNPGDDFFEGYFLKWLGACNMLYNDIRTGRDKLFNKNAGSNIGEFFPVLMEHFFENPEVFKSNYPLEYEYTCVLLNQDPVNRMNPVNSVRKKILSTYTYLNPSQELLRSNVGGRSSLFVTLMVLGSVFFTFSLFTQAFICAGFFFLLLFVPFIVYILRKNKVVYLSSSGLVSARRNIDPLSPETKKFPWEKIIRVEFLNEGADSNYYFDYDQLHFMVYDESGFSTVKLFQKINPSRADELEKLFRAKRVAVMRRKR